MKIGFMGLGKLGLPCALALDNLGYEVFGYDVSSDVRGILESRSLPYREEGAQALLDKHNIEWCSIEILVGNSDIIFVPIQTPHDHRFEGITPLTNERKDFDYTFLKQGIAALSSEIEKQGKDRIVVIISTVLPGTVEREIKPLLGTHTKLCYNPFFIAMGTTIPDFLNPEFVLLGVDDEEAAATVSAFYARFISAPVYKTTIRNAELIKVSYNTFIGMKIVFANTLMEICQKTGCDVDAVTGALGLATRRLISTKYLSGGMGDGGGCHPRDNIAMSWLAKKLDLSHDFFEDLMQAREDQTEWIALLAKEYDLPVFILGKAFKEQTNLTVGSPSLLLQNLLKREGIEAESYDPFIDGEYFVDSPKVFIVATKHQQFVDYHFPPNSVVIDPWRYIPDREGVKVIRLGEK